VHTQQEIPYDNSVCGDFLKCKVKYDVQKKNWKWLVEENVSKNYTKTIRLFALDFYELIVDSAFGLINYHLRNLKLVI